MIRTNPIKAARARAQTGLSAAASAAMTKHSNNKTAAAAEMGLPRTTFRDLLAQMTDGTVRDELLADPMLKLPGQGFIVKKASTGYDADGTVKAQWIQSSAGPGEKYEVPAGHVVKGESSLLDPSGKLLARWVKTREGFSHLLEERLVEVFSKFGGQAPQVPKAPENLRDAEEETLTVYPLPDLHFGMYAWKPETGADYDTDIAAKIATEALRDLVAMSRPSKRAVLLGLGDYFHQNDQRNVTPKSGHRLDVDGRWGKVYAAGSELMLTLVDELRRKHEQLDVVMLPGNHDEDAAITLRVALSLYYRGHQGVSVYNEPGLAWYTRFGKVLLGATHGHTLKPQQMAMMLATDRSKDWGESEFRHMLFGHVHHESAKEIGSVRVESFQTPAARDAYAQDGGFRSGRSLSAITFHTERGEIGRHRVNILTKPG